jgi:glycosyltransferase involved in cell wall biosynthesis
VLSSVHEGFGIVLQEAMQVGLPIVSTNYGGQVDLINDGENGYLIKYGDVKKAKDSICKILNDDELYQKMRTNNLNKVKEYKSSNVAQQYLNLLNNDKDAQKRN